MNKKFKYAVFVGRFAPFHKGHNTVVEAAMDCAEYLIMVLGSNNKARDTHDPFDTEDRRAIIRAGVKAEYRDRIIFRTVEDFTYNDDKWVAEVQRAVHSVTYNVSNKDITLIGMNKDESSYYLGKFPLWSSVNVTQDHPLSATTIRKIMFDRDVDDWAEMKPIYFTSNFHWQTFMKFAVGIKEKFQYTYDFEKEYPTKWGKGPHLTVDSIVVQSGHILLIQRGKEYGHGQWALPGGFLNADKNEPMLEGALRELREETGLKVPTKVLKGSLVSSRTFDLPNRSARARLITTAFYFKLTDMKLPDVVGLDDADHAEWVPLSKLWSMKPFFFEDHFAIVSVMTGAV
jgi:bifunctional NMN adenylyltransferase/nudix hydrolase